MKSPWELEYFTTPEKSEVHEAFHGEDKHTADPANGVSILYEGVRLGSLTHIGTETNLTEGGQVETTLVLKVKNFRVGFQSIKTEETK